MITTPREALRRIRALVEAGEYRVSAHLTRDRKEPRITNAELVHALCRATSALKDADGSERWHLVGPSLRTAPERRRVLVTIESNLIVITAWRTPR